MPLPPVMPPIRQTLREPVPEPPPLRPEPVPMREPVAQRPVEPVRAPPPPVAAPRDPVRELPAPPILTARAPTPVQTVVEPPRPPQPVAAPEAPRAPREPPRRHTPVAVPAVEVSEAPMPSREDAAVSEPAPPPLPIGPAPEGPEIGLDAQTLTALYLRNPKPGYPAASRRVGEQGTVLLRVFVTAGGDAKEVSLKTSSGFARLDRAALDTVRSWKFVPARREDKAIDAWVLVPIKFSLK
jgi:protein TonB